MSASVFASARQHRNAGRRTHRARMAPPPGTDARQKDQSVHRLVHNLCVRVRPCLCACVGSCEIFFFVCVNEVIGAGGES